MELQIKESILTNLRHRKYSLEREINSGYSSKVIKDVCEEFQKKRIENIDRGQKINIPEFMFLCANHLPNPFL